MLGLTVLNLLYFYKKEYFASKDTVKKCSAFIYFDKQRNDNDEFILRGYN